MAEVYRAKLLNSPDVERFYAIKRILPHLAEDKDFLTMFINEAKVAVVLDHPNVCQIYELGRLGQSHYIAMDYIPGRDVEAIQSYYRKQKRIMSVSQACFIIAQAAEGLDYAHRAVDGSGQPLGLVHRDVSPQNLLVTYDGIVKLIDFGVSKASRKTSASRNGVIKGKFSYMSPEQAADAEIDHRSDIFALGVVFWEMLTGRRLFQSESEFAIIEMIKEGKIEEPSKYNRTIPSAVEKICMKALERDVSRRYQWASEMALDLVEFIRSCKTPFTQWHLKEWMCKAFEAEVRGEWEKIPVFKGLNTEEDIDRYNEEHADELASSGFSAVGDAVSQDSDAVSASGKSDDKNSESSKSAEGEADSSGVSGSAKISAAVPNSSVSGVVDIVEKRRAESDSMDEKISGEPNAEKSGDRRTISGAPKIHRPIGGKTGEGKRSPIIAAAKSGTELEKSGSSSENVLSGPADSAGSVSKSLPGVKAVSLDVKAPDAKASDPASSGQRLSISSSMLSHEDEDVELIPDAVDPTVSDPEILRYRRSERKAKTRKGLVAFIIVICLCFISAPVLIHLNVIKPPRVDVELPTSAVLMYSVVPEIDGAKVTLYKAPKEGQAALFTAEGISGEFSGLAAGNFVLDVTMPGYEPASYSVMIENGTSKVRLEMTEPLPEIVSYTIDVEPADVRIYVDDKLVPGEGETRTLSGIKGKPYSIRAYKPGYEAKLLSGTVEADAALNVKLDVSGDVSLQVSAEPVHSNFVVYQDNKVVASGETPYLIPAIDISKKSRVVVSKSGFESWTYDINADELDTSEIRVFADLKEKR